ncbi:unnamed protein product [Linum trigynum]|uniref:Uncharacterized protein n=1 Tax=Linum trigynum TaxID=586398 RepID=A0AAV2ENZ5_9ROSI
MPKTLVTTVDQQTIMSFKILQGERTLAKDCLQLGSCTFRGIPPAPRDVAQLEVTFEVNADGILSVVSLNKATRESQTLVFDDYKGNLTKEEVEKMIRVAAETAEEDKKAKERIEVRNRLERYMYDVKHALGLGHVNVCWDQRDKTNVGIALREASD